MKRILTFILCAGFFAVAAQKVIDLPHTPIEGVTWKGGEKNYYSKIWQTQVVTNVSKPTLTVYQPDSEINTGSAVIIAPGGGLYAHSIKSEGNQVAEWLTKKGVTAFVLKYRLVPTGEDGVEEITALSTSNPNEIAIQVGKVLPYAVQDGLNAVAHVRNQAESYGVNPNKIGFMGFSAGGAVTMGVSYEYDDKTRPDFIVPVYAWTDAMPVQTLKDDAPPALIVCATDDPLDLAKGSIEIYNAYLKAQTSVGLHMYSQGGHGFGMRKKGLPSDNWIERFYDWAKAESFIVQ